jgi:orotidine-5'-phosphate decarboxylase
MALPKINDVPKYDLVIPSTKQSVKYRPFFVKEQKVLLMAMESQDQRQIINTITDTIQACLQTQVDFNKLTAFDLEYLFVQIRAKSVGERSNLSLKCQECDNSTAVVVDLEKITVDVPKTTMSIKLNDKFTLKLRYPTHNAIMQNDALQNAKSATELLHQTIITCLDSLQSQTENIRFDDEPRDEVANFLEALTSQQFDQIVLFVQNIPKLTHTVSFDCNHCKHHNDITLQGIRDFF